MDEERDAGTEVDEYQRWAIAQLARGLSPCQVTIDEQGREVDRWGRRVVERLSDEQAEPPA